MGNDYKINKDKEVKSVSKRKEDNVEAKVFNTSEATSCSDTSSIEEYVSEGNAKHQNTNFSTDSGISTFIISYSKAIHFEIIISK